jgi:hypothetical protein
MNPKPFWVLKNFTVPVAMVTFLALLLLQVEICGAMAVSAFGQEVPEGSRGLLTKEKAAFAGGARCGAAFKSGKGLGTFNALAPYAV